MDPMLDIPKDRKRLSAFRLCLLLGMTVLAVLAAEARTLGF